MDEPRLQISPWVLGALALQLALLVGLCAWAVRAATRPLRTLADAADALGADRPAVPLAEDGPREVQRAAVAFNHMQQRIQTHLQERMQILAAVSHDLQTPITRLRLRADLLDDTTLRDKLHADLAEMQSLVEEGIAYARSSQAVREPPQRVDLRALVDSAGAPDCVVTVAEFLNTEAFRHWRRSAQEARGRAMAVIEVCAAPNVFDVGGFGPRSVGRVSENILGQKLLAAIVFEISQIDATLG